MYPTDVIKDILKKANIVKIVAEYLSLERSGFLYYGKCPFHNEKSSSFTINAKTQTFLCYGCGMSGNVIDFIMNYNNCSFAEAITILAAKTGVFLPDVRENNESVEKKQKILDMNRIAAKYYYNNLRNSAGEKYLVNRNLSADVIRGFGLGFSKQFGKELYKILVAAGYSNEDIMESGLISYGPIYSSGKQTEDYFDKFWDRVMFPIMDENNKVIGFGGRILGDGKPKYLNSPETIAFDKGSNLYGLNRARYSKKGCLMLVEGYMDVISMHQAGFSNAIASLGTALTEKQVQLIAKYTTKVYVCYDSDKPGTKAAMKAIPLLQKAGLSVKVVNMNPAKDPDEFIKNFGRDLFTERLSSAEDGVRFMLRNAQKENPDTFYNNFADILLETM